MTGLNLNEVYSIIEIASTVICTLLGLRLVSPPYYKKRGEYKNIRPLRYIAARKAVGIAYILIGILTTAQLLASPDPTFYTNTELFPVIGLLISTSQALLFTLAALALFNSKLVRRNVILGNCYPILVLFILALLFQEESEQKTIRTIFFAYYVLQLVTFTVVFFMERRKYLNLIEDYFGIGEQYDFYKCKGIVLLYLCAMLIGICALVSYFFTTIEQHIVFTISYTLFYLFNAIYFLWYSKHSQRIQDVTSPEHWNLTETCSREFREKEKQQEEL